MNYKGEILFILSFPWYSLFQRVHQFAKLFKRENFKVTVIERREIVRLNSILNKMNFTEHNLYLDKLYSIIKLPLFKKLDNFQFRRYIKSWFKSTNLKKRIIWLEGIDPRIDYKYLFNKADKDIFFIFDVSDNFPEFYKDSKTKNLIKEKEEFIAKRSNVTVVSAKALYEKFKKYNSNTLLLKNGVDISIYDEVYSKAKDQFNKKFPQFKGKKIVGYHGAISWWFDFSLMQYVIEESKDLTFVFVGMIDVIVRKEFSKILNYPNVFYLGVAQQKLLPYFISLFDVGIIPFKINKLTVATNPIKLYEYLAMGKPVVSSALPEVFLYEKEGIVKIAKDFSEFNFSLKEMIKYSKDPSLIQKRRKIAYENSWESKFEILKSLLYQSNSI